MNEYNLTRFRRWISALQKENNKLWITLEDYAEQWGKDILATRQLCQIYFTIAAEAFGEDSVRQIRDEAIKKIEEVKEADEPV